MKKILPFWASLILLLISFTLPLQGRTANTYTFSALATGATTSLDGLSTIAGEPIQPVDGDKAFGIADGAFRSYLFVGACTAATAEPGIIKPLVGTGCWELVFIPVDYKIDALLDFGRGVDYSDVTLLAACTASGSSLHEILVRPGTWEHTADRDYKAICPNTVFTLVPGATISHGAYTLNIPNIDAGKYQIFTGSGLVTGLHTVYTEWWGGIPGWDQWDDPGCVGMACVLTANRAALVQAINSVSNTSYGGVVNNDCNYDYRRNNKTYWPFYGVTLVNDVLVIDTSYGNTPGVHSAANKEGTQVRYLHGTVDTTPTIGIHNGEGQIISGAAGNPYLFIDTQKDLTDIRVGIINEPGAGAEAYATVVNGVITAVTPVYTGRDYVAPTVTVIGTGTGAVITANVVGGSVTSYTVVDGGTGYTARLATDAQRASLFFSSMGNATWGVQMGGVASATRNLAYLQKFNINAYGWWAGAYTGGARVLEIDKNDGNWGFNTGTTIGYDYSFASVMNRGMIIDLYPHIGNDGYIQFHTKASAGASPVYSRHNWYQDGSQAFTINGATLIKFNADNSVNMPGIIQQVIPKTADFTVLPSNSSGVYTNAAAGGTVIFTLPVATTTAGTYEFHVVTAHTLRIDIAGTTDLFHGFTGITLDAAKSAGKYMESTTAGSYVVIKCVENGVWSYHRYGTWADE